MISEKMEKALNEQIREEYYSSYLYLAMSAYFESLDLRGMARWMRVQAQEEHGHAMKFFDYVFERGGTVVLAALNEPAGPGSHPLRRSRRPLDTSGTSPAASTARGGLASAEQRPRHGQLPAVVRQGAGRGRGRRGADRPDAQDGGQRPRCPADAGPQMGERK